eukprot:TRINITY_DN13583_c0_g1_i1.p1 TRINITY_DN13583_c0_g1~~TRINITY_DN13583_c0_g1_i1.p1  ORF type:complete len:703 (+),score=188.69 TRINITY_DN13583_c0_g1_i1:74-2182(+)
MAFVHQGIGHHNHHPHQLGMGGGGHARGNEKSRVLLLRRLPEGVTTRDVEKWINSRIYVTGGQVKPLKTVCVLLLKDGVALAELESLAMSDSLIKEVEKNPGSLRFGTQVISVHYSTKSQLSRRPVTPQHLPRVLMVLLKQPTGKVPMDELFWICSQFGKVEKISIVGQKTREELLSQPQACDASVNVVLASGQVLIQFTDPVCAKAATEHLNGRKIHFSTDDGGRGECTLHASPARVAELTFRVENETRKDFSQVNEYIQGSFPDSAALSAVQTELGWSIRDYLWGVCWVPGGQYDPPQTDQKPSSMLADEGMVLKLSGLPLAEGGEHIVSPKVIFRVAAMYGQMVAVKFCYRSPGCCLLQYRDAGNAALRYLSQLSLFGRKCGIVVSHHRNATNWNTSEMSKLMHTLDQESSPLPVVPESLMQAPSSVLMLYNSPERWGKDELAAIVGHFIVEVPKWRKYTVDHLVVNIDPKGKTVEFVDSDVAFVVAGLLNGSVWEGIRLKVCFSYSGAANQVYPPSTPSSPIGKSVPTMFGSPQLGHHSSSIPMGSPSPISAAMQMHNYSSVCSSPTTGCPPLGSSLHSQQSWGSVTGTSPYTHTSYVINGYGEPLANFYPEVPTLVVEEAGRMSISSSLPSSKEDEDEEACAAIEDCDNISLSSNDLLQNILPAFHKSFDRSALQDSNRDSRTVERTKQGRCSSSHR